MNPSVSSINVPNVNPDVLKPVKYPERGKEYRFADKDGGVLAGTFGSRYFAITEVPVDDPTYKVGDMVRLQMRISEAIGIFFIDIVSHEAGKLGALYLQEGVDGELQLERLG